ncbi:argininosuccinate lyase [uncultured Parasutterella sp.]|uniref:argininosuccinate lyase n=1 Tax=uncultured Parasutterella sp. TaxID=1263098 RepID=UPI0025CEDDE3|nr:argininosuccinate lyase [uncultured Parasutterella sp.]
MSINIQRGKIKKAPAPELIKYIFKPAIEAELHSYLPILEVNRAHVLMLEKQGIIKSETASAILSATEQIEQEESKPSFEIDPNIEDIYLNLERYLSELTSPEIGGQQHTARSRNDLKATTLRMQTRDSYLKLCELFLKLRSTILLRAEENLDTVMAGITHMQPSEPITFAHYLSGILSALERDYMRLAAVWEKLNESPLGAGSMGSTSFPIDRDFEAELLGFNKPMRNSIDCVASRDYAVELVFALGLVACTLSRLGQDLYNWSTPEYAYIEVDDSCAGCSSIMPQKKNPITLEHLKAKASHLEGILVSMFTSMKSVIFTHTRDVGKESTHFLSDALKEMEADFELANVTMATLDVKRGHMYERARRNFCTVTELANFLVRNEGIPFREAHEIVADAVGTLCEEKKDCMALDKELLDSVSLKVLGKPSNLTHELIDEALDPRRVVFEKRIKGGTAPEEVSRQLVEIRENLERDTVTLEERREKITESRRHLHELVHSKLI